jgi:hypothetical protein
MLKRGIALLACIAVVSPVFADDTPVEVSPLLTVQELSRPGGSVPLGAQRVPMLTVQLQASCATDVRVESLTLQHQGLGNPQDIAGLYAYSGNVRRSRSVAFRGNQGLATLHLRSVTVPRCGRISLDILGDIRDTAAPSGEHSVSLVRSANVVTNPSVPVLLNLGGQPATRTIPVASETGSVTAEPLSLPNVLTYGSARTLARLRLKALERDQQVTSITFVNDGSARDSDLQNLFLETSGHSRLSPTVPTLTGDRIRIELQPPLIIKRNEVRLVNLKGDVRASRRKTVRLLIQETSDLEAEGLR